MISVRTTLQYVGVAGASPSDMERAAEAAMGELGAKWHGEYLPLHFDQSAYLRYSFKPRSRRYNVTKRNRYGHTLPMVYTGYMMMAILSAARIATSPHGVEIRFSSGSRALNFSGVGRKRTYSYPDMRAELTAVSTDEPDRFARFLDGRVVDHLNEITAGRAKTSAATPLWSM